MNSETRDLILSFWEQEGDVKRFTDIRDFMVQQQIFAKQTNHKRVSNDLKQLCEAGYLVKTDRPRGYQLVALPFQYRFFTNLRRLRDHYELEERDTGSIGRRKIIAAFLGFQPKDHRTNVKPASPDEQTAYTVLINRLARVFEALCLLRKTIIM